MRDFEEHPLRAVAARLRAKQLSAEALAEWIIENHNRYDAALNAYKTWDPQAILAQARAADLVAKAGRQVSPLHGIPISVKDLIGVGGYPIFAGSPRPLPMEWAIEGPIVRSIRNQMGVITGKTHTTEFAFGALGTNKHWGTPRNPWDSVQHRVPGGSSSGAGVSLGERSALLAIGTDSGGSIRMPASSTGVVGLKTSFGRWSVEGVVPLASSLDTVGLLARSVSDAIFGFAALDSKYDNPEILLNQLEQIDLVGVKIGVCESFMWEQCSPGIVETIDRTLNELVLQGARLIKIQWPEAQNVYDLHTKGGVHSAEFAAFLRHSLPDWETTLDGIVQRRIADGAAITASEYILRKRLISQFIRSTRDRFAGVDVIAAPTIPITPPIASEVEEVAANVEKNRLMFRNTCVANILNMCALTMPVGLDAQSMPVGLQFFAPSMREEQLLSIAFAAERTLGTPRELIGTPRMCTD